MGYAHYKPPQLAQLRTRIVHAVAVVSQWGDASGGEEEMRDRVWMESGTAITADMAMGGGDDDQTYRGDSFICAAAVQA